MSVWYQSMSSELLFYSASELWYWRRLLRVPWTEGRSNQSILKEINWIFIGRIDAEAEAPIFWPPDVKSWLTEKDPDAGKDWRQVEKGATEDEMVGWQHRPNGHAAAATAAAAAKSLQPCPTLCDRQQPTSLPRPQDSPGKNTSRLSFPSPLHESEKWKWSHSVVSDFLQHHGLQPARLLCPWGFPGKSTGVGYQCLLRNGHEFDQTPGES